MKIIDRMQYHAENYGLLVTREELLEWADIVSKLIEYSKDATIQHRKWLGFGPSTRLEILLNKLREET